MFFLIGMVIGIIILTSVVNSNKGPMTQRCEDKIDRKHKWILRFDNGDRRGYLVCKDCGKLPGED